MGTRVLGPSNADLLVLQASVGGFILYWVENGTCLNRGFLCPRVFLFLCSMSEEDTTKKKGEGEGDAKQMDTSVTETKESSDATTRPLAMAAIANARKALASRPLQANSRGWCETTEQAKKESHPALFIQNAIHSLWTNAGYEKLLKKRIRHKIDFEQACGELIVAQPGTHLPVVVNNPNVFDETDKSALVARHKVTFRDLVILRDTKTSVAKGRSSWVYALRMYAFRGEGKEIVPFICRLDLPVLKKTIDPFQIILENTLVCGSEETRQWMRDVYARDNAVDLSPVPRRHQDAVQEVVLFTAVPLIHPRVWENKKLRQEIAKRIYDKPPEAGTRDPMGVPVEHVQPEWVDGKFEPKTTEYDPPVEKVEPKSKKTPKKTTKRKAAAAAAAAAGSDSESDDATESSDDDADKKKKTRTKKTEKARKPAKRARKTKTDADDNDDEKDTGAGAAAASGLLVLSNGSKWSKEYGVTLDGGDAEFAKEVLKKKEGIFRNEVNTAPNYILDAGLDLIAFTHAPVMSKVEWSSSSIGAVAVRVFVMAQYLCHELCAKDERFARMNDGAGIHPSQLPEWVRLLIEEKAGMNELDLKGNREAMIPYAVAAVRVATGHSKIIHPAALPENYQMGVVMRGASFDTRCSYGGMEAGLRRVSEKLFGSDEAFHRWSSVWRPTPGGKEGLGSTSFQTPPSTSAAAAAAGGGGGGGAAAEDEEKKAPSRKFNRIPAESARKLAEAGRRAAALLEEADPTAKKLRQEEIEKERAVEKSIREGLNARAEEKKKSDELLELMQQSQRAVLVPDSPHDRDGDVSMTSSQAAE